MKRIQIVGLTLVALFAFSAVAAASAMAEEAPKFEKCVKTSKNAEKKYTGSYTDKACTVEATEAEITEGKHNKYALEALGEEEHGLPITAKSKSTTITTHGVNGNPQVIVCKKDKLAGELYDTYGSGKLAGTVTFEKCEGNASKTDKCGNVGPETIEYQPIFSQAVWGEAGEAKPELASLGGASFECGGEAVEIEGILLGTIENTSKGVNFAWGVSGGTQEDQTYVTEGEEYSGHLSSEPAEEETTVAGKEEVKAKGVSAR